MGEVAAQVYGAVRIEALRSRSRFCGSTRKTLPGWKRCYRLFPFCSAKTRRALTRVGQEFCREVVLWKQFKHPNLLPLVGAKNSPPALVMVSEWMEHGTIADFIVARPEANRLKLVSILPKAWNEHPWHRFFSWRMLLVD